jgi:hypothetical protein
MLLYAKVADAMQADQIRLTVLGIKESNPSNYFHQQCEEARCDAKPILPIGSDHEALTRTQP